MGVGVRCDINTGLNVVTACFVLHNFLRKRNDLYEPDPPSPPITIPQSAESNMQGDDDNNVRDIRKSLISTYFN